MELLEAFKLASQLHDGQVDKAGRPYIEHLVRVMLRAQAAGASQDQLVAALLHDSVEDGRATFSTLLKAGISSGALNIVTQLSKGRDDDYDEYIRQICQQPEAALVKLCDMQDNLDEDRLRMLPAAVADRLREKYRVPMATLEGVRLGQ